MTRKNLAVPLLAIAMVAGAAASFAGLVSAQTAATTTATPAATTATAVTAATPTTTTEVVDSEQAVDPAGDPNDGAHDSFRGGAGGPHVDGNVTAINGTTITLTEETNESATVYTVDASKATFTKNGAASALSSVAVGDKIFVQGPVSGSSVTATQVMDGHPSRGQ